MELPNLPEYIFNFIHSLELTWGWKIAVWETIFLYKQEGFLPYHLATGLFSFKTISRDHNV